VSVGGHLSVWFLQGIGQLGVVTLGRCYIEGGFYDNKCFTEKRLIPKILNKISTYNKIGE